MKPRYVNVGIKREDLPRGYVNFVMFLLRKPRRHQLYWYFIALNRLKLSLFLGNYMKTHTLISSCISNIASNLLQSFSDLGVLNESHKTTEIVR